MNTRIFTLSLFAILVPVTLTTTAQVGAPLVAAPRELFAAILDRIQRFGVPPPLIRRG